MNLLEVLHVFNLNGNKSLVLAIHGIRLGD
jgi:hypothetical protein